MQVHFLERAVFYVLMGHTSKTLASRKVISASVNRKLSIPPSSNDNMKGTYN